MGPQRFSDGSSSFFTLYLHPPPPRPLRKSPEPFGPAATLVGPKTFGLPAMSLGTCRCRVRKQDSRGESGAFERARGDGPGPGGTWFAGPRSRDGLPDRDGWGPAAGAVRRWGMAVLLQGRTTRRGSTAFRQTDPWNCSAGEDPLPEPFRARLPREARSEGPKVLFPTKDAVPSRSSFRPG